MGHLLPRGEKGLLTAHCVHITDELLAVIAPLGILARFKDDDSDPFAEITDYMINCSPLAHLAAAELACRRGDQ